MNNVLVFLCDMKLGKEKSKTFHIHLKCIDKGLLCFEDIAGREITLNKSPLNSCFYPETLINGQCYILEVFSYYVMIGLKVTYLIKVLYNTNERKCIKNRKNDG